MPFTILYGGELAFLFLGVRIARWMWRSRERVLAMWRERRGAAPGGPSFTPDPMSAGDPAEPARVDRRARRSAGREEAPLRRAA